MTSRRRPNTDLSTLLSETGWTYGQFARAVNTAATRTGRATRYDRSAIAHWLAGTRPRHPVPHLVREVLSARLGRPLTLTDVGLADTTSDPVAQLADLTRELQHTHPYQPVPALPPPPDAHTSGGPVGDVRRDHALGTMTEVAVFHLEAFGGGYIRATLAAHLQQTALPWTTGRPARTTLAHAARLTHLLAHATADMNAEGQAQAYHLAAAHFAARAGEPTLYAISLRALSTQALRQGYPSPALLLARRALAAVPPDAPRATRAYLTVQLAAALAATRQHTEALAALARAEDHLEHDANPTPFASYPLGDFAYQKATVLASLGEPASALRALRTSLRARPADRVRARVLTRARLAEVLHASGHTEAACDQWSVFLSEAAQLRSAQATARVARMRTALLPWRTIPAAAQLLARTA